ncbi:MAG: sigma-70 family RNA polymerase sigma factor [Bryobacterales bacterium]|nr:sigma-70 family RNA polymerase sigma factor [Bryobacterales bacterium]
MLQLAWKQPVQGPPLTPSPLAAVFEQHHGLVFRTAYRMTGNAADAEDVLQTIFLRLLRQEHTEMRQPESYLRRAAINASLDLIRDRSDQAAMPPDTAAPSEGGELRQELRQALAKLDPKHAEMFVLRYFEGHSNGEIAQMMGISSLLVAVTLHRTRARLQKTISLS